MRSLCRSQYGMDVDNSAILSKLPPGKMVAAIKGLPELTVESYVREHFVGKRIKVSGVIRWLENLGAAPFAVISITNDADGVAVHLTFDKPLSPDVRFLEKGEHIFAGGTVVDVRADGVMVEHASLLGSEEGEPSANTAVLSGTVVPTGGEKSEHWWQHTLWGSMSVGLFVTIVGTIVGGLLLWAILHHYGH